MIDGINVQVSARDVNPSQNDQGVVSGNVQYATGQTLQDGAPRPQSLWVSGGPSPVYYSDAFGGANRNGVLFEFENEVTGFGAWFGDLETRSDQESQAILRLFDSNGERIGPDIMIEPDETYLDDPSQILLPEIVDPALLPPSGRSQADCGGPNSSDETGCGNGTTRWIGFIADSNTPVKSMLVFVGDDDPGDTGNNELLSFIGPTLLRCEEPETPEQAPIAPDQEQPVTEEPVTEEEPATEQENTMTQEVQDQEETTKEEEPAVQDQGGAATEEESTIEEQGESAKSCLEYDPERPLIFNDLSSDGEKTKEINFLKNTRIIETGDYILSGSKNHSTGRQQEEYQKGEWSFEPQRELTRLEVVKTALIANCLPIDDDIELPSGEPPFSDLPLNIEQNDALSFAAKVFYTAKRHGIIKGYEDGSARPFDIATQYEIKIINRKAAGLGDPYEPLWLSPGLKALDEEMQMDESGGVIREDYVPMLINFMKQSLRAGVQEYTLEERP